MPWLRGAVQNLTTGAHPLGYRHKRWKCSRLMCPILAIWLISNHSSSTPVAVACTWVILVQKQSCRDTLCYCQPCDMAVKSYCSSSCLKYHSNSCQHRCCRDPTSWPCDYGHCSDISWAAYRWHHFNYCSWLGIVSNLVSEPSFHLQIKLFFCTLHVNP